MMRSSQLVRRPFTSVDGPTTVALEPKYWEVLEELALENSQTVAMLLREIDDHRFVSSIPRRQQSPISLASAVRIYVVEYLHEQAIKATRPVDGETLSSSSYTELSGFM
jgi:predicted DNA-binding ribbon-helix-helix protein